jgi:hypothetical protein
MHIRVAPQAIHRAAGVKHKSTRICHKYIFESLYVNSCSAAGTQNSRAHIYYMYPTPKHFQTIFISILCPTPSFLSKHFQTIFSPILCPPPQTIFQIILSRFCVLLPPSLCPSTQRKRLHLLQTVNFSLLAKETLYFLSRFFCFL